jgi:hypothetical protein
LSIQFYLFFKGYGQTTPKTSILINLFFF